MMRTSSITFRIGQCQCGSEARRPLKELAYIALLFCFGQRISVGHSLKEVACQACATPQQFCPILPSPSSQ